MDVDDPDRDINSGSPGVAASSAKCWVSGILAQMRVPGTAGPPSAGVGVAAPLDSRTFA